MDGSIIDHSDSDSGESWTLLENQPSYGDDAPYFPENSPTTFEKNQNEGLSDKDDDTDGISIISDSDPESSPCDIIACKNCLTSENHSSQHDIPNFIQASQQPSKYKYDTVCNEDDFLGDGSHKLKTYVHKRNKRLSMVLNIIMLGSVITAAGVAIGHMWGAKNECSIPTPSVNRILSNLYKLQEENAYLRKKLKEMTALADNINFHSMHQPKINRGNKADRPQRCKKVFEGPLNNKNEKSFKCVDSGSKELEKTLDNSEILNHEKEFLIDITKLKRVYNQNKSWLDDQIHRRLDKENNLRFKRDLKGFDNPKENLFNKDGKSVPNIERSSEKWITEEIEPFIDIKLPESGSIKSHKAWHLRKEILATKKAAKKQEIGATKLTESDKSHEGNVKRQIKPEKLVEISSTKSFVSVNDNDLKKQISKDSQLKEKKVSYADSLKADSVNEKVGQVKNHSNNLPLRVVKSYGNNRKHRYDMLSNLILSSDEDIQKDDRYTGPIKIKRDKKKHDRHKIHKKQKRKNKYEEWEMKGGYLKDFDEFSMTSSQVNLPNDIIITPERKYLNNDFENYLNKLTDMENTKNLKAEENTKNKKAEKGKKAKNKDLEWYDKRYALRAEARRKLEQELFGESSPNNAAWYFRRMSKREQCRAQKDNTTFKKFTKKNMNYKMKH